MPDNNTTINIPPPAGGVAGGATTGAATGAAIGSVVPGIGTGIGAAVGAVVGTLTSFKGKTQKLNYEQAVPIAEQVTRAIYDLIYPAIPAAQKKAYANDLGTLIIAKLTANAGKVSDGWQAYRTDLIQNQTDRNAESTESLYRTIFNYVFYVALNYDVARPDDFKETLLRDMLPMFQSLTTKFPDTKLVVNGGIVSAVGTSAPSGGGGSSAPAPAASQAAASTGDKTIIAGISVDTGKVVLIAGFLILIAGLLYFTRKR